jgi:hypothetical protein
MMPIALDVGACTEVEKDRYLIRTFSCLRDEPSSPGVIRFTSNRTLGDRMTSTSAATAWAHLGETLAEPSPTRTRPRRQRGHAAHG